MNEYPFFLPTDRSEWSFSVKSTSEPAEHSRDSDGLRWQCELVEPGLFHGHMVQLRIGSLYITQELTNLPLKYRGCDQVGSVLFHSGSLANGNISYRGQAVDSDTLVVTPGRTVEYGSISGPVDLTCITIDNAYLAACSQCLLGYVLPLEFLSWGRSITESSIVEVYHRSIREVFRELTVNPARMEDEDYRHSVAEGFVRLVLRILVDFAPHGKELPRPSTRAYIVERAVEYINENLSESLSIADLCRAARVSRRTLSYSFEEILGVSPARYLLSARLSRVHNELLRLGDKQSVYYVAHSFGFNHLGRFAKYYQQTYGELPSETCGYAKSRH